MVKIQRITVKPFTNDEHDATPLPLSVTINGRPRTLHFEGALWDALLRIAEEEQLTLDELCNDIADVTAPDASLADAPRAYVLGHIIQRDMSDDLWPEELRRLRDLGYARSMN
jgi:predicted DNA-binding ribbon-helix-helix protein